MKEITKMKLSDLYFKRLDATEQEIEAEREKRVRLKYNKALGI